MRQNTQNNRTPYARARLYSKAAALFLLALACAIYCLDLSASASPESLENGVFLSVLLVGAAVAVSFLGECAHRVSARGSSGRFEEGQAAELRSPTVAKKISVAEFEAQKSEFTRKQIETLVGTKEYKSAVEAKVEKIENWNWQK